MVIIINLEVHKMEENDYSVVLENVKGENEVDDDYHYYDRNRFGKKYCIISNIELTDQEVDKVFSIIRKKERSKKSIFNRKFSCSKEISQYFDGRSCQVQEYENERWLMIADMTG